MIVEWTRCVVVGRIYFSEADGGDFYKQTCLREISTRTVVLARASMRREKLCSQFWKR